MSVISRSCGGSPSGKSTSGFTVMVQNLVLFGGSRGSPPFALSRGRFGVDPGECLIALRGFGAHAWCMSSVYEHPTLQMRVTNEQRDRAGSWLREAYAGGRVSASAFDTRVGPTL